MAFNPANFKLPKVRLYMASWGPDRWVCHDYDICEDKVTLPLVFSYEQQKVHSGKEGPEYWAYHYKKGAKHGAEKLNGTDGKLAKLWTAEKMVKSIVDVLKKSHDTKVEYEFGRMTDDRNDVYAIFPNGLSIAVHIARPDGEPEDFAPLWYSYADTRDKAIECFPMGEKKAFLKACRKRLQ